MAGKRLYPRSTVKNIVKVHSNRSVSKNADILVFLEYALFIEDLMKQATLEAKKDGGKKINSAAVEKATKTSLRRFRS